MRVDPNRRTQDGWAGIEPIPGESLDGVVFDFAGGNFIGSTAALLGENCFYLSVRGHGRGDQAKLLALSKTTGVPVAELEARAYRPVEGDEGRREFFGVAVHRTDLDRRRRTFAPAALALSPHHRAMWHVRAFPFCTETWQYLTDRCHRCARRQGWQTSFGVGRCDGCLADLSRGAAEEVDPDLRDRLALAAGVLSPDPAVRAASIATLPPAVADLGPAGAFELLARLVPLTDPALPHGRDMDVWRTPAPRLARAMAEAWDLAAGWPTSVTALAGRRISTATRRYNDGNGGATTRFLRLANDDYTPAPVARLVRDLRASLDLDDPAGVDLATRTIDCVSVAAVLGRGTAVVADLRRRGYLASVFAHRGGMPSAVFDRAEVDGIRADMADRSTIETLSWRLGIPNYGIEQMAALGVLGILEHPYFAGRYGEAQLRTSSADRLEALLGERADNLPARDLVPLRQALLVIGGRLKPWGSLMRALAEDADAPFVLSDGGRLAYRISIPADRLAWLRSLAFPARPAGPIPAAGLLSKKDAGEVLNLGPKQQTRVLAAASGAGRVHKATIPVDTVLNLAAAHATHGELAMRSGLSVPAVRAAMRGLGREPTGPLGFERVQAEDCVPRLAEIAAATAGLVDLPELARRSGLTRSAVVNALAARGIVPVAGGRYDRKAVSAVLPELRRSSPRAPDRVTNVELSALLGVSLRRLPSTMRRLGHEPDGGPGWPRADADAASRSLPGESRGRTATDRPGPAPRRRPTNAAGRGPDGRYGATGRGSDDVATGRTR